jgi:hypothetical protein
MKSLSRNVALTLFFAFAIGSIYGCAEKPITFAGPGVQIWKLNIYNDKGFVLKDQTLVLTPSETEKDVFHVTVTIDAESESPIYGKARHIAKWKGEIRNGTMICNVDGTSSGGGPEGPGLAHGTAKGTFSKRRASGTVHLKYETGPLTTGKWNAERIS